MDRRNPIAGLAGVVTETIKSIELQRLPLSEKIAFRLQQQTGIDAKWLLDNELGEPPPDRAQMRQTFMKHARAPGEISTWHT